MFSSPSDELGQEIVELLINPTPTRERLCDHIYKTAEPGNPIGLLQEALEAAEEIKRLERKVFDAVREGRIKRDDTPGQIDEAETLGVITSEEADQIRAFDARTMALLAVNDFAPEELTRHAPQAGESAPVKSKAAAKKKPAKKTAGKPRKKKARSAAAKKKQANAEPGE